MCTVFALRAVSRSLHRWLKLRIPILFGSEAYFSCLTDNPSSLIMSNTALVLESKATPFSSQTRQIPTPGPKQIVVRNHAVATNPVDYLMQDQGYMVQSFPTVLGSDIAGTVHSTGSDVTKVKNGDRVAGFACMIGTGDINQGAFQQYTILEEHATVKLPSNVSFEDGSNLPMAVATSGVALFTSERLNLSHTPLSSPSTILLVWGASSSVGTAAVQFGCLIGYTVFATASPRHHDYLKQLGATQVFDYNDSAVVNNIISAAKAAGIPIATCYAAISSGESPLQSAKVLSTFKSETASPPKLCLTLPWPEDKPEPEGIEITMTGAFLAVTQHPDLGAWLFGEFLQEALEKGTYTPSPAVEVVGDGLDAIVKALEIHRKGVSGKKLVATLS